MIRRLGSHGGALRNWPSLPSPLRSCCYSYSMRQPKPRLSAEARRALLMLADYEAGCITSLMLMHGFSPKLIAGLIKAKLATTELRPMKAGAQPIRVMQIRITDTGRVALEP